MLARTALRSTLRTLSRPSSFPLRPYSSSSQPEQQPQNDYEKLIASKLHDAFEPSQLSVEDISGGCGSMFAIDIVSKSFKGKPMIKQHRMVNEVLAEDLKQWHGVRLTTKAE
ncbi:bola protein [Myxozyma melibiosi]|uniref:Bola protein n=1 Tax=Myxozyma melibiosi TaxID=54550 RepID=A0ABR1F8I6_9ASCO